jgi:tetratricopeptide (TPR) repeat protein
MELGMPPGVEAQAKATEATLNRLFQEGAQAYQAADYRTALEKWQAGLNQARALGNKQYSSQLLMNIGLVYWYLGQYEQALVSLEQASIIFRELGDRQSEGRILNNIGLVYQNLGKYEQALKSYEESLALKRITGDRQGEGNTLGNIGVVYDKLGQYEQALASSEQALAIAREIGDRRMENRILSGIGLVYKNLGQYKQALEYSEQALTISQGLEDRQGESIALTGIGLIHTEYGQYEQALEYHQQTLALKRAIGDLQGEGTTLSNIGIVYHRLGQYEQALKYYEQALAIKQAIGDRQGEGMALNNIGTLYDDLKQYEQALEYHQQALAIFQELGLRRDEGLTLGNIGVVYANLGQYEQALRYFEQSLAIKQAIGDRQGEGTDLSNIGAVHRKRGQYEQADQSLKAGLKICYEVGAAKFLWIAQSELAAVEAELERYAEAVVHYEQALETIETIRAGLSEKETKTSFTQNKLFVYDDLIILLQTLHEKYPDKGYHRKALEIFERKQGRVFLEEMGKSGARLFAGLPKDISQRERDLEIQLEQVRTGLADEHSKPISDQNENLIQKLEERKKTLNSEQASLQEQIKTDYPGYYALKYPKPVTLAELQQNVLQSGEIMLIYNVMQENTVLWVIRPNPPLPLPGGDSLQMYMLPVGEQTLQEKIANVRETMLDDWETGRGLALSGEIVQPERIPFPQASHDLYNLLIPEAVHSILTSLPDPLQEGEVRKTLNIVPTGPLYALPFEILLASPPTPLLKGEGLGVRYLIEDIPISYLSSASLLKTLREAQARRTATARYPLLAFAHPVYRIDTPQETGTIRGLRVQAYRELLGGGLPELPETAEEAKIIADLLNAPGESDPLQLRESASHVKVFELNSRERLDDYDYLLFAMHGVLPGEVNRVTQSALVFSDNFLTMADVFGLQLNAKLVSLSACNTGMGKQVKGEGVIGLTRAFMYAGTPTVAVTLWSVESLSARDLDIGFFRHLNEGMSPAQALQTIKVQMLRGEYNEKYRSPYYWAPFVVFGDGS